MYRAYINYYVYAEKLHCFVIQIKSVHAYVFISVVFWTIT